MTPTDIESIAPIHVQGMNRKFFPCMGKHKCNHSYINDYFHALVKILLNFFLQIVKAQITYIKTNRSTLLTKHSSKWFIWFLQTIINVVQ